MKPMKYQAILTLFALSPLASAAVTSSADSSLPEVTASMVSERDSGNEAGVYGNPGWTKHRRFATTRVFVQRNPWEVGVEQWWRVRTYDSGPAKHLFIEEIEIGLPYRMQLDFYFDWVNEKHETSFKDLALELRWALADWDVIPLNPTLYAEYKWTDADYGPDVLEFKLLLGDDIGKDWQYGVNLVWEQELAGEKTTEWQVTGGLSRTISDRISLGLEAKYVHETVEGARNDPEHKILVGPSAQLRLGAHTHLDLVGLFGVTKDAPNFEGWVVFGIDLDFGHKSSDHKIHQPVSGARN